MPLPFFYADAINSTAKEFVLNEDASRHVVQVLRMQVGERMQLTDGKGHVFMATIANNDKKKCAVEISDVQILEPSPNKVSIAISLVKNTSRFEWFLEKATEIGVAEIIPLICTRTEKQHFRYDRMNGILVSAMLQSQQAWVPVLHQPVKYADYIKKSIESDFSNKFIAHCEIESEKILLSTFPVQNKSTILIGPEGDFSREEIATALQNGFLPVSLGQTRLRTETAGMVAAVLLTSK